MIAKHSMIYRGVLYRRGQEIPIDEPTPPAPTPEPEPEPTPEPVEPVEPEIEPADLPKLK